MGTQGVAINFVRSDDIRILRDIEQYYSTQIDEMPMVSSTAPRYTCVPSIFLHLRWSPSALLHGQAACTCGPGRTHLVRHAWKP